jgi:mannose-1-phosphate guanylyltransferase
VPFLTHLFSRIRKIGVEHAILGTAYEAEVFEKHFGDAAELGLDIDYIGEDVPLCTGYPHRRLQVASRHRH